MTFSLVKEEHGSGAQPLCIQPLYTIFLSCIFHICKSFNFYVFNSRFYVLFFLSCVAKILTKVEDEASPLKNNNVFMLVYAI
jgi:hypothetical protein